MPRKGLPSFSIVRLVSLLAFLVLCCTGTSMAQSGAWHCADAYCVYAWQSQSVMSGPDNCGKVTYELLAFLNPPGGWMFTVGTVEARGVCYGDYTDCSGNYHSLNRTDAWINDDGPYMSGDYWVDVELAWSYAADQQPTRTACSGGCGETEDLFYDSESYSAYFSM